MFNLGGSLAHVSEFIAAIEAAVPGSAGSIDHAAQPLPFPEDISADELAAVGKIPVTPLAEGVASTAAFFRDLLQRGTLVPEDHGMELTRRPKKVTRVDHEPREGPNGPVAGTQSGSSCASCASAA